MAKPTSPKTDPAAPACGSCGRPINRLRDHRCPTCERDYCTQCCTSGEWTSVAAGVDVQVLDVTCPRGHAFREESRL
jgi:hypothetical protein